MSGSSLGEIARAKEIFEEGIARCREVGYTYRLPYFLLSLGYMSMLEDEYERGATLNEEAAALCLEHGYKADSQYARDNMGWAALLQGDHQRARLYYSESLLVGRELGEKMIASESLEGEACVAGDEGKDERRGRLFGAAQALLGREAVAFQHTPEEGTWREPYRAPPARCFGRKRGKRRWSRVRLWSWRKQSSTPSPNRSPRQHLLPPQRGRHHSPPAP